MWPDQERFRSRLLRAIRQVRRDRSGVLTPSVVLAAGLFLCVVPAPVMGHGMPGGEATLEGIPTWLYLSSGAGVVVGSFALTGVYAGRTPGGFTCRRQDLDVDVPPLLTSGVRVLSVLLFVGVVVLGLFGPNYVQINSAPSFLVEVYWWVSYGIFAILVGNVWPSINPWKTLYEWSGEPRLLTREYPPRLGALPALVVFLAFVWLDMVVLAFASPRMTGLLALAYGALMWVGMAIYGEETWLWNVDAFTRVFDFFGRFAPLSFTEGGIELRGYAVGLVEDEVASAEEVLLVIAMLFALSFDGFKETPQYIELVHAFSPSGLDLVAATALVGGALVLFGFGLFAGAYVGVSALMNRLARGTKPLGDVMTRFVLTLAPISIAYHVAHYSLYYVLQHELLVQVLLSPLPGAPVEADPDLLGFLAPAHVWYFMVASIVVGHVIAVWVAHHASLEYFESRTAAIRSQVPMMALMVVYTIISLWIISHPFGG